MKNLEADPERWGEDLQTGDRMNDQLYTFLHLFVMSNTLRKSQYYPSSLLDPINTEYCLPILPSQKYEYKKHLQNFTKMK